MYYVFYFLPALAAGHNLLSARVRGSIAPPEVSGCGNKRKDFDEFVRYHGRSYASDVTEYQKRKALFDQRADEAEAHNCRPGKRFWNAGLTSLSDRTVEELAKLRGRKGGKGPGGPSGFAPRDRLATLESDGQISQESQHRGAGKVASLPDKVSWSHLQAMKEIFDQGPCGSCWASATTVMLRAHTDIYTSHKNFSVQQLVSCTPNPDECGGSGGCNGSTGELALDYVYYNGLDTTLDYKEGDFPCPTNLMAKHITSPQPNHSSFLQVTHREPGAEANFLSPAVGFGMLGWSRLPVNNLLALKKAVYQEGPVAVSIVAGYAMNAYVSGIMNNCTDRDMVINHLVVLTGYDEDKDLGAKYWNIQNSWGTEWGERGMMRMIRLDDNAEEKLCGQDKDPIVGTGCKGGPSEVTVCGSCGILFDNVVPHFHGNTPAAQLMEQRRAEFTTEILG